LGVEGSLIVELGEWSRVEDELREEWGRLANRLREQLHRFSPQLLALCPAADESWFWALIALAPTPPAAQRLRRAAVVTLLREHRIRRLSADQVLAVLRSTPLRVAPGTVEAASAHVALLIPRLELIDRQRRDCARRIEHLLDALATTGEQQGHRDVTILRSLPGVGRVVAATMLAEASRLLAARDYQGLRTQAGVAPVTRQSGKRLLVGMRYACNPRLRNALYYWGFISVRHDAPSRQHYRRLRGHGHSHSRALRGVADRLLTVLMHARATDDVRPRPSASGARANAVMGLDDREGNPCLSHDHGLSSSGAPIRLDVRAPLLLDEDHPR